MIAPWGWAALAYGAVLAGAAVAMPRVPRRGALVVTCLAYALAGLAAGSFAREFWVALVAPGVLLLAGYWLSGPFFQDNPQRWLERRLLASDRWILARLTRDGRGLRIPRPLLDLLEAVYASVYVVVGVAALIVAAHDPGDVVRYWTIVIGAGLCCFVTLPWVRARPPRMLEPPWQVASTGSPFRALNATILDRSSVQAATIPSGHVAVAVAAAAAVLPVSPMAGGLLLVLSVVVVLAAFLGRYHYAFDCVSGAAVGGFFGLV
jgi:hypothetical protein